MTCETVKIGGHVAIVCSRGRKRHLCCACKAMAPLQCDWPTESGGTCSKPICRGCARADGDKDYCPFHRGDPPVTHDEAVAAGEAEAQKVADMFGIKR